MINKTEKSSTNGVACNSTEKQVHSMRTLIQLLSKVPSVLGIGIELSEATGGTFINKYDPLSEAGLIPYLKGCIDTPRRQFVRDALEHIRRVTFIRIVVDDIATKFSEGIENLMDTLEDIHIEFEISEAHCDSHLFFDTENFKRIQNTVHKSHKGRMLYTYSLAQSLARQYFKDVKILWKRSCRPYVYCNTACLLEILANRDVCGCFIEVVGDIGSDMIKNLYFNENMVSYEEDKRAVMDYLENHDRLTLATTLAVKYHLNEDVDDYLDNLPENHKLIFGSFACSRKDRNKKPITYMVRVID